MTRGADEAQASKEAAARTFDRWSKTYERDPFSRYIAGAQRYALSALALGPGDRLLDVGCGTGAAVRRAAGACERAVGLDLSEAMIERARGLSGAAGNAEFVQGDSERLPFDDGAFTALLCTSSLHHYPEPRRALAEFARVLAPGGRLALGDGVSDLPHMYIADRLSQRFERGHVHFHTTRELCELVEGAGLRCGEPRRMLFGCYVVVPARAPVGD